MNILDLLPELFELINNCLPHQTLINKQFIDIHQIDYSNRTICEQCKLFDITTFFTNKCYFISRDIYLLNLMNLVVKLNNFKLINYYSCHDNIDIDDELIVTFVAFYKNYYLMKKCLKYEYKWHVSAYIYVASFGDKRLF